MSWLGETQQELNERGSLLVASVAALAVVSSVAYTVSTNPNAYAWPHSETHIIKLAPDAARLAFADEITCHLDSVGPTDGTFPDNDGDSRTVVKFKLGFDETSRWQAARDQYDKDDSMLWRDEDVEVTEYDPFGAEPQQIGDPTDMIIAQEVDDGDVAGTVSTQALNAGGVFEVAIREDTETGAGGPTSGLRETKARHVCGAFRWVNGQFEIDDPPVGHSWSKTLVGSQANDFTRI